MQICLKDLFVLKVRKQYMNIFCINLHLEQEDLAYWVLDGVVNDQILVIIDSPGAQCNHVSVFQWLGAQP